VSQVFVAPDSNTPFGNPRFDPLWEAAQRHGLPVAFHLGSSVGMNWLSPVGYASYFLEVHSTHALPAMAHITSMIFEGVFERFPRLKVAWIEHGFTFVPPLMWRLDNSWRLLRSEVPHLKRRPSEVIRAQMRFATQPIDDVARFRDIIQVMEWMDGEHLLMFATDYPHHDADDVDWLSPRLPEAWRSRILCENAIEFYGLPSRRPLDGFDLEG
jgi:predicted TIM-barrel fold metal-dependent hydrolase